MLKRFLFPVKPDGTFISVILIIVRVVFGVMIMASISGQTIRNFQPYFPILSVLAALFPWGWLYSASWPVQWRSS